MFSHLLVCCSVTRSPQKRSITFAGHILPGNKGSFFEVIWISNLCYIAFFQTLPWERLRRTYTEETLSKNKSSMILKGFSENQSTLPKFTDTQEWTTAVSYHNCNDIPFHSCYRLIQQEYGHISLAEAVACQMNSCCIVAKSELGRCSSLVCRYCTIDWLHPNEWEE